MYTKELLKNLKVCVNCGYHHPMNAWERLDSILDEGHSVSMTKKWFH